MSASQIFTTFIIHSFIKKEDYRHLHGAVREYMINRKERPQVSMSHLDQLLMTLCSFYELVPDSTITNTTSYENLDVTVHPLFLIVNWTSPFTIVCWVLVFKNPRKFLSNGKKVLKFLIWYFDFWKLMSDSSLLNLKILNLLFLKFL